jgi:hypothetical protein
MESAGTEGEALHDKSIIPMDVEGSDSQPVQKQGQAGDKAVHKIGSEGQLLLTSKRIQRN